MVLLCINKPNRTCYEDRVKYYVTNVLKQIVYNVLRSKLQIQAVIYLRFFVSN